jgi:Mg-chelatase subunit ChlD
MHINRFSRRSCWSCLPVIGAALAAGCGKPAVMPIEPGAPGLAGSAGGRVGVPATNGPPPSFSLPDGGTASAPAPAPPERTCAEEVHQAENVPLDLLLVVDASGSMNEAAGMRSKWSTAQAALGAFIGDPGSAGLGLGLQFFPAARSCTSDRDCFPGVPTNGRLCQPRRLCSGPGAASPPLSCSLDSPLGAAVRCPAGNSCVPAGACSMGGRPCANIGQACPANAGTCQAAPGVCLLTVTALECDPANFQQPAVGIGPLPATQTSLQHALANTDPAGGTPMGPALRGAFAQLRAHLAANPGRKAALILLGDGLPSDDCAMNDLPTIAADISAAFTATPSIPTYVIGVFAPEQVMTSQLELDRLAAAGGSNRALILAANDDLTMRLQATLNQVRGAALACEYRLPAATSGPIDLQKVNVRYSSGGVTETVPYVERADRCDPASGGWYYDAPPAPAGSPPRILVCDATCRRFNSDQNGKVDLVFGCATQVVN